MASDGKGERPLVLIAIGFAIFLIGLWWARSHWAGENSPAHSEAATPGEPAGGATPTPAPPESAATSSASPAPGASPASASPTPAAPVALSEPDRRKISVLDQILKSRNDNDPRLDSDFHDMSPELKSALHEKYTATPAESRNARGTMVFLVGRELKTAQDLSFLSGVLAEPPCLSLADCNHRPPPQDEHATMGAATTLAYPQIVAVKSIERALEKGVGDPELRKQMLNTLRGAQMSEQQRVSQAAQSALSRFDH